MKQIKIGVGFGLWRLGMPPAQTIANVAERAEEAFGTRSKSR
jgi:hypothetical protein